MIRRSKEMKLELSLDLELLQEQKRWLYQYPKNPHAEGLIGLLDAIQDQIHETGQAGEREVFGNL
jgi:hypothetical protein